MSNVVQANFNYSSAKQTTTKPLWQYDYGQVLKIEGLSLPEYYEVHFANDQYDGEAKIVMGDDTGVKIPDEYLYSGDPVRVWIVLHEGPDDGETVYKITIPVNRRSKPTQDPPSTAQEQSDLSRAIAALNGISVGNIPSNATVESYDDTELRALLNNKVDKVPGKGLSTNDFTDELKNKLDSVEHLDGGVDISWEDYNALTEEEKNNGTTYYISEANPIDTISEEMTQEEYDALPTAKKMDGTIRFIPD